MVNRCKQISNYILQKDLPQRFIHQEPSQLIQLHKTIYTPCNYQPISILAKTCVSYRTIVLHIMRSGHCFEKSKENNIVAVFQKRIVQQNKMLFHMRRNAHRIQVIYLRIMLLLQSFLIKALKQKNRKQKYYLCLVSTNQRMILKHKCKVAT